MLNNKTDYFKKSNLTEIKNYKVIGISDGDTFIIDMEGTKDKVRLIGVDTPEKNDERKPKQCYSQEASEFTKQKVLDKWVSLVADPKSDNRDKYGRLLRYVYISGEGDLSLNYQLIINGYGFAIEAFDYTDKISFLKAQDEASSNKVGLWLNCTVETSNNGQNSTNPISN
jgi:micrococcal nuclease